MMWDKVNQRIQQALAAVRQAFRVVTGTVDSSTQSTASPAERATAGEQLDGAEYFQHYGLTTSPPPARWIMPFRW
ncbi:phage baseplate assembly protein [Escherichia coli]